MRLNQSLCWLICALGLGVAGCQGEDGNAIVQSTWDASQDPRLESSGQESAPETTDSREVSSPAEADASGDAREERSEDSFAESSEDGVSEVGAGEDGAACPAQPDPLQNAPTVALFQELAEAQVTNKAGETLVNFTSSGSTDYAPGGWGTCAGALFSDASLAGNECFFLLPPTDPSDFVKVLFPPQVLPPAAEYVLSAKVGIRAEPGSTAQGVVLSVVVAANPTVAEEPAWEVVDTLALSKEQTLELRVPLGLWPLRSQFRVALQVSCVGNNYYDAFLVDGARIEPVRPRPGLGINHTNLVWQPATMLERVDQMAQIGARQLRIAARKSTDIPDTVNIVRQAKKHNMRVLLNVLHEEEDFVDPSSAVAHAGAEFEKKCGWSSGVFRLSAVTLPRYRDRLSAYVGAFRVAELQIDAYEIGNEYDWVCFNGDLPLSGAVPQADLESTVNAYAQILKASYELLHDPKECTNPKVLTFGASNGAVLQAPGAVAASEFFTRLRNMQGVDYLALYTDGIGEHLYYSPEDNRSILQEASALAPPGKPIWVTEWGVSLDAVTSGYPRYAAFKTVLTTLNSLPELALADSFLYAFEDGVWRVFDVSTNSPLYEARIFQDYPLPQP